MIKRPALTGKFERGERGPICKKPSDGKAWIAPARNFKEPEIGVEYILEIVGSSNSGKLRFAAIKETIASWQDNLKKDYLPAIRSALSDPTRVKGLHSLGGTIGVEVEAKGETFILEIEGFAGDGYRKPWLVSKLLKISFSREKYPVAEEAMASAEREYDEKSHEENERREAYRTARIAQAAQEQAEQVAKDAANVAAYLAEYPQLKQFVGEKPTLHEVQVAAVEHGLAKAVGEVRRTGGLSYKHQFYSQKHSITVGGVEEFFDYGWDDDEVDD